MRFPKSASSRKKLTSALRPPSRRFHQISAPSLRYTMLKAGCRKRYAARSIFPRRITGCSFTGRAQRFGVHLSAISMKKRRSEGERHGYMVQKAFLMGLNEKAAAGYVDS